ncbi:hypothetical protein ABZ352_35560 [Streptomyces griseofuscus]|uniref:hypothetical protein n=1 Tax=Streptomyces griseofuscus TaxID=146922 RepID=UPI0034083575
MATVHKPETVVVELTMAELELIRAGLRAFRTYESAGDDDNDALCLLADLEGRPR